MNGKYRIGLWAGVLLLLATALALMASPTWACGGGVICVDADAAGAATGLSWTDAFTNVQAALDWTNADGGATYEIWVAEGVYYPDEGAGHVNNAVTETFRIAWNNVQLYGGFAGSETTRDARDWMAHPTVLSGDIDANDWNTDTNGIAETWNDIVGGNAYHVLYLDGVTNQSITGATALDGFIITAGQANSGTPDSVGGGLYCVASGSGKVCSPLLIRLIFSGNWGDWGGGMYNYGNDYGISSPTLIHVTFSGNRANSTGGGMVNYGSQYGVSSPTLTHVTFSGNHASSGGGMTNFGYYYGASSPTLTGVTFSGNQAVYSGGGMYNYGAEGSHSSPRLTDVTFSGNFAIGGGGMFNEADRGHSSPTLIRVAFNGNQADFGGGMYNRGSGWSSPYLFNVVFSGNRAVIMGGGMVNDGVSGWSSPVLVNVTFSGNHGGGQGGGMYSDSRDGGVSSPFLINCILWGNTATSDPQIYNSYATPTITYSDVQGGYTGVGNRNLDPQFVAPLAAASAPTTAGNYRLRLTSPVIDAGDNFSVTTGSDLGGNPRQVDIPAVADTGNGAAPIVDMGAYEAQPGLALTLTKSVFPAQAVAYHGVVIYTLVLSNGGADNSVATLTDVLPAQVDFEEWIAQPSGAAVANDQITWNGVVPATTDVIFTFTATHTGDYGETVTNTVMFNGVNAGQAQATFTVEPNSAPTADDDAFTVKENSRLNVLDVLSEDADPGGDNLTVFAVGTPDHGGAALNAMTAILYTPATDFSGQEVFTYTVSDGHGGFDTASVTVTVTLLPTYTLSIVAYSTSLAGGTVTADPDLPVYKAGTPVTLTATPAEGWYFGGWTGDLNTAAPVEHLTMSGNKAVTATFVTAPPVTRTLTIAMAGEGSGVVTPTVGAHTYISGALVILDAMPAFHSSVAGWSGDPGCAAGQVTLDADKVCTATFVLEWRFLYLPLIARHLP